MKKILAILLAALLLLPVCAFAASPVTITSVRDNGDCTVSMNFKNPNGSKTTVGAMMIGDDGAGNKLIVDETYGSSYQFDWLAPGESYMVVAMNGYDTDTMGYDIVSVKEPSKFNKFFFEVMDTQLTYFVPKGSSYSYNFANDLSPREIQNLLSDKEFWVRIDFNLVANTSDRTEKVLTVVRCPNGYVATQASTVDIEAYTTSFWQTMVYMNGAFENMIDATGSIPTGTYQVRVYLDGQFAGSSSFSIY